MIQHSSSMMDQKNKKIKKCSTNSVIQHKQNFVLWTKNTHTHTHKTYVENLDISENNIIKCQSCQGVTEDQMWHLT